MTQDPNRVTVGERYGTSTDSSNLRLKETRCDADMLIAAAWLPNDLGALLFRLAREVEGAKGEHGIAQVEFDRAEQVACRTEREALSLSDPSEVAKKLREAKELRDRAEAQALSSRLMVLMHLKSLREVRQALWAVAIQRAAAAGHDWGSVIIGTLVGQVLDVHLDRTCHGCQGRGSNGGYGTPQLICRKCAGTGRRGEKHVGKDQAQRQFAGRLLDEIDAAIGRAAAGMIRALKGDVPIAQEDRDAAERMLGERLLDLRGVAAEAD
jgi:hypothetical protein